jgi:hypothetical protein
MIEEIERLREEWNPQREGIKIRILFIGESPPEPGRFFYNRNTALYYATFCAFSRVFRVSEPEFLEFFQKSGCYLYDMLKVPGQKIKEIKKVDKSILNQAKEDLKNFIRNTRPDVVIVILKTVYGEIEKILSQLRKEGIIKSYDSLPFPTPKCFNEYVERLCNILNQLIKQGILAG